MISVPSLTREVKGNMNSYKPPFTMTDDITILILEISESKNAYEAFISVGNASDSSCFVTFMLEVIRDTLRNTD